MTYTRPTAAEERMLSVWCSYCYIGPAEWCWDRNGKPAQELHMERFHKATKDGLLPSRVSS